LLPAAKWAIRGIAIARAAEPPEAPGLTSGPKMYEVPAPDSSARLATGARAYS
jgi:hypothetical protein